MRRVLLVLTKSTDRLNDILTSNERTLPGLKISMVDLTAPEPDYDRLLDEIFAADSVQIW